MAMSSERLNIGVPASLAAESFGEPGRRTFRLLATTVSGEVGLWMEKEQLLALGAAVSEILDRVPEDEGVLPRPVTSAAEISGEVSAHIGGLSLGFDHAQSAFVFEASELWNATLEVGEILILASRKQLSGVQDQVEEIVAAGRPRCPMCGTPLTEAAHFCPPSNGHSRVADV